jgi:3-hydroxyisobutyrate dehydrogenase-like beta-hydroxyacid dehydrogenase
VNIGFIGAGKVGATLGKVFSDNGLSISGYYSRTKKSAKEVCDFIGTKSIDSIAELVSASDNLFITVTDGEI